MSIDFDKRADITYQDRPSVYALVFQGDKLAIVNNGGNLFLPGGGITETESPENAIVREGSEELGWNIHIVKTIGQANDHLYAKKLKSYIRKSATYYLATTDLYEKVNTSEPDHKLIWVNPKDVIDKMFHPGHSWAIQQAIKGK